MKHLPLLEVYGTVPLPKGEHISPTSRRNKDVVFFT